MLVSLVLSYSLLHVLLSDGKYGIIQKVRNITYDEPQTTHNFEVQDYHTYYVSESSVCVHNGGPCKNTTEYMTRSNAVKEGKKFLGEGFTKEAPGRYVSQDGLRQMRFDFSHHGGTSGHINLEVWNKSILGPGKHFQTLNRHIFFIGGI